MTRINNTYHGKEHKRKRMKERKPMTSENDDAAIQKAEAVWDSFDIDLARNVAWLSLAPVAATADLNLSPDHSLTMTGPH